MFGYYQYHNIQASTIVSLYSVPRQIQNIEPLESERIDRTYHVAACMQLFVNII